MSCGGKGSPELSWKAFYLASVTWSLGHFCSPSLPEILHRHGLILNRLAQENASGGRMARSVCSISSGSSTSPNGTPSSYIFSTR
mmetsp:Transcript_13674/g.28038  ORF Transcript_13674/g.28038 Transcript_13674/m.28038 type:complete len:85 (-) Transcript_13674:535-789(-)